MELEVIQKQFIEVKGISHLIEQNIISDDFFIEEKILNGNIKFQFLYYSTITNDCVSEEKEISYQILVNKDKNVNKINIKKVDYQVIFNQGIEVEFELNLDVSTISDIIKDEIIEKLDNELIDALDNRRNENIDGVDKIIDESIIEEHHDDKDDIEKIMYDIDEDYQTIKIIFTNNENDIKRIANLYNKTLEEIYEENNYQVDNRIIIKTNEFWFFRIWYRSN